MLNSVLPVGGNRLFSKSAMLGERGGGVAAWSPASLPNLVVTLLPAQMRSASLLWQDIAGMTLATADGQTVGRAQCPYTGAIWVAQAPGRRPLLKDRGSGKWALLFDGVDDGLLNTSAALSTGAVISLRGTDTTGGVAVRMAQSNSANTLLAWRRTGNTVYVVGDVRSTQISNTIGPNTLTLWRAGSGNWAARFNGSDVTNAVNSTAWGTGIGVGFAGANPVEGFAGDMAGLVVSGAGAAAADVLAVETYLGLLA